MEQREQEWFENRIKQLEERLAAVRTPGQFIARLEEGASSTEVAAEDAVALYIAAKGEIDAWQKVCDAARDRLTEIISETGETKFATRAGSVNVTSPGVSISYDVKALDALVASSPSLAQMLLPHRSERERPGYLRVTGAK